MADYNPALWKKFLDPMVRDVEILKTSDQKVSWLRYKTPFPNYLDFCHYIEKELSAMGAKVTWHSQTEIKLELVPSL